MDTKSDAKETMDPNSKKNRAASSRDPMKFEVVKSCVPSRINIEQASRPGWLSVLKWINESYKIGS